MSTQPYQTLARLQLNSWRRENELEIHRKYERPSSVQLHPATKRFKSANTRLGPIKYGVSGLLRVGSFMLEGSNIFHVVGVARRDILVGITDRVGRFVSIATRRATSELIAPSHFR